MFKKSLQLLVIISFLCFQQSCWDGSDSNIQPYVRPLEIVKLSENDFLHVSYLKDGKGGYIPCNGFFRKEGSEVFVFDTPLNDSISEQLIAYITRDLKSEIKAVMVSHSHNDAAGGINAFVKANIPTYASLKTTQLLAKDSIFLSHSFEMVDSLFLGTNKISMFYPGAGHTNDNAVAYIENDHILLGGCLIKPVDGSKGNLADASIAEWSNTIRKVKETYPNTRLIIPGHGRRGGEELLDYTIRLFEDNFAKVSKSLLY
ncbi:subclass B1 metallo-beta-lactamase [Dokdonia sp. Hel_I_53]|uniref:subclass B1 metallo-beta-lactamase n=1 Tax=Dokdonia sp. Hel_I_53 TaxID=1566287 RepID=UPI00119954BB|nr:subclass B1 metallo-beta-lactamase [Dokdonia sp. Hel_I_53]TVZ51782.1 metallo-beta-lactamase class B [Dokdonia sp. Hel_I_53]